MEFCSLFLTGLVLARFLCRLAALPRGGELLRSPDEIECCSKIYPYLLNRHSLFPFTPYLDMSVLSVWQLKWQGCHSTMQWISETKVLHAFMVCWDSLCDLKSVHVKYVLVLWNFQINPFVCLYIFWIYSLDLIKTHLIDIIKAWIVYKPKGMHFLNFIYIFQHTETL